MDGNFGLAQVRRVTKIREPQIFDLNLPEKILEMPRDPAGRVQRDGREGEVPKKIAAEICAEVVAEVDQGRDVRPHRALGGHSRTDAGSGNEIDRHTTRFE